MTKKKHNQSNIRKFSLSGIFRMSVFIFVCVLVLLSGCRRPQPPQLPSNKPIEGMTTAEKLLKINAGLAQKEDSLLNAFVQENAGDFTRTEVRFWYKKEHTTQNRLLQTHDVCVIDYRLYLLDGTFLEERTGFAVNVGRKEFFPGLDEALQLMRTGETAVFVFPSNLAFRLRGYGNLVPPYTPVMFRITVRE